MKVKNVWVEKYNDYTWKTLDLLRPKTEKKLQNEIMVILKGGSTPLE